MDPCLVTAIQHLQLRHQNVWFSHVVDLIDVKLDSYLFASFDLLIFEVCVRNTTCLKIVWLETAKIKIDKMKVGNLYIYIFMCVCDVWKFRTNRKK